MVLFLRVSRGLGLDPESLKVPSNQLNLESLCFTGHGVAFGARALLRARVSKVSVEVSNQPSVTVRKCSEKVVTNNRSSPRVTRKGGN